MNESINENEVLDEKEWMNELLTKNKWKFENWKIENE